MNEQHIPLTVRLRPSAPEQAHELQALGSETSDEIRQRMTPPPEMVSDLDRGLCALMDANAPCRGRFVLDGDEPRGKGGMGRVWLAHDDHLGRRVALKEMLPQFLDHEEARRRFLLEAQVTSQLQHPGIVPVYEMAHEQDGTGPFYTMRFVEGRSLSEAIGAFHANRERLGRPDPVELRDLLGAFVTVCNTLAYAHSRGVIHRDLKPDNVRLGAFGEVVVLDWGLVLVRKQGLANDAELVAVDDPVASRAAGGTPSYMAPEQAAGRTDAIDARSDVFALGGILFAILAGRAPYQGSFDAVIEQARQGNVQAVRSVASWVPKPLAAACMKALQALPENRYPTASELAEDVRRFLAEEPVHAWPEPLWRRVRRWMRRHRVLAAALAGALVVGLAALGGIAYHAQQRGRQAELSGTQLLGDAQVSLASAQATRGEQARIHQSAARVKLAEAEKVLEQGRDADLRARVQFLRAELARQEHDREMLIRVEAAREQGWSPMLGQFDLARITTEYGEALSWYLGVADVRQMDEQELAAELDRSAIRLDLLGMLDSWSFQASGKDERAWVSRLADRLDSDPFRQAIRKTLRQGDSARVLALAQSDRVEAQPTATLQFLAEVLRPTRSWPDVERVYRLAWNRAPSDFWINVGLAGSLFHQPERVRDAVEFARNAVVLRPESAMANANLATLLQMRGNSHEAEERYLVALKLQPNHPVAHYGLGLLAEERGKNTQAESAYRTAIQHRSPFPEAHNQLGILLHKRGAEKDAEQSFLTALQQRPEFVQPNLNLALLYSEQGKTTLAEERLRAALKHQPNSAAAQFHLGSLLQKRGEDARAMQHYLAGLTVEPRHVPANFHLGTLYEKQGKLREAEERYRLVLRQDADHAESLFRLGTLLEKDGRLSEAAERLGAYAKLQPSPQLTDHLRKLGNRIELDRKLVAVLAGTARPTDDLERLAMAFHAQQPSKRLYAASARLFAEAFPKNATFARLHRTHAARAAVQAGCGQGVDGEKLDHKERERWRQQALTWLQEDLAIRKQFLASAPPDATAKVRQTLAAWTKDADFAGVRESVALAKLPEAERRRWLEFWAEVNRDAR